MDRAQEVTRARACRPQTHEELQKERTSPPLHEEDRPSQQGTARLRRAAKQTIDLKLQRPAEVTPA